MHLAAQHLAAQHSAAKHLAAQHSSAAKHSAQCGYVVKQETSTMAAYLNTRESAMINKKSKQKNSKKRYRMHRFENSKFSAWVMR